MTDEDRVALWELFPMRIEEINAAIVDDITRECMTAEALNGALLTLLEEAVQCLREITTSDLQESGGRALEMLERFKTAGHVMPEVRKILSSAAPPSF